MVFKAEGWFILKVSPPDESVFYRVFASWRLSNAWRLSSGAEDLSTLVDKDDYFEWPQLSGSVYILPKQGEGGATFYTQGVLNRIIEDSKSEGATIEIVDISDVESNVLN